MATEQCQNLFTHERLYLRSEVGSTRSILALILVALLLAVGASEGAPDSREVVQASEILAKIERGEPVEYDGVIVEGLDMC